MKKNKCGRLKTLWLELNRDWDRLNLAAKLLTIVGADFLLASLFIAFFNNPEGEVYITIESAIRANVSGIFGFILSSNLKNTQENNNTPTDVALTTEEPNQNNNDDEEEPCEEYLKYYSQGTGNSVQLMISILVCVVSGLAILVMYARGKVDDVASVSQLKDLMTMSAGFLLGESQQKK
jgi:hypothetical protein